MKFLSNFGSNSLLTTWLSKRKALGLCWVALIHMVQGCGSGTLPSTPIVNNPVDEKSIALAKPGELVSFYQGVLRKRAERNESQGLIPVLAVGAPSSGGDSTAAPVAVSGTNVQEAGVDEDDLIKSDGNRIFALTRVAVTNSLPTNQLVAYTRGANGLLVQDGSYSLGSGYGVIGMQFAKQANTLAVIKSEYKQVVTGSSAPPAPTLGASLTIAPVPGYSQTLIDIIGGQTNLPKKQSLTIDGSLLATRLVGNTLYIASTWWPRLAADVLPATTSAADRTQAINALTAKDVLPTISVNGATPTELVSETDCFLQTKNASTQLALTTVVAIQLDSPTLTRTVRCLLGGQEAFYMTPQSVYFATARWDYPVVNGVVQTNTFPSNIFTDIHKFSLADNTVNYRGSGSVDGHLGWVTAQKAYRFSEFEGALRVVTFTGTLGWTLPAVVTTGSLPTTAASPATLSILKEGLDVNAKAALVVQAKLPNATRPAPIGKPNEQVYAVRFQGNKGYVVTFRRTDPLYVLDLTSTTDPKIAGELNITGFSDYLLPVSSNLLLGIGKDADANGFVGGVKVALFDVTNVNQPIELTSRAYGDRFSATTQDFTNHGVNMLTVGNTARIALPMRLTKMGANGYAQVDSQALRRFEINTVTKSFVEKTALGFVELSTLSSEQQWGTYDVSRERSLQIDNSIYYLSGGRLQGYPW
jgi:Beta propeller domain